MNAASHINISIRYFTSKFIEIIPVPLYITCRHVPDTVSCNLLPSASVWNILKVLFDTEASS